MRKGRSAAGGWGVGAADSRDGWLRPLGGGGGPGSPRGWLAPKTSEQENRGGGRGRVGAAKGLAPSPSAPSESPHPPQRVRSVATRCWGFSSWNPIPEALLEKLAKLTRKTPPCPALETSLPSQGTERKGKEGRKKGDLASRPE